MPITNLFKHWTYRVFAPGTLLRHKYSAFKDLLRYDNICLELIADLEEISYGTEFADYARISWLASRLSKTTAQMAQSLMAMDPSRYMDLMEYHRKIDFYVRMGLDLPQPDVSPPYVVPLKDTAGRRDMAGGKGAHLGRVATSTDLHVPETFVVTTTACAYFMESNGLQETVNRSLKHIVLSNPDGLPEQCRTAQAAVMEAEVPEIIAAAIEKAADSMGGGSITYALRSSALAEDGEASFAGQFASELDVPRNRLIAAYKQVLASKYMPRAVTYRILNGLADEDIPMAVLLMPMVKARSAGVIYTRDPERSEPTAPTDDILAIYAVPGQGKALVDGNLDPEIYQFSRKPQLEPLGLLKDHNSLLDDKTAASLAKAGVMLEELFQRPQDVEWAVDDKGAISVLQSRPVSDSFIQQQSGDVEQTESDAAAVLASGLTRISAGKGCGRVYIAESVVDPSEVPNGCVLLVRTLSPALVRILGQVNAVVSKAGSRGSHFASVAREFGLPVLVGSDIALKEFQTGQEITVDADNGRVLQGCPESVQEERRKGFRGRVPQRLEQVMSHIAKLTLTDPESENFRPDKAKSFHDLVRFCHEKSVSEMFSLVDKSGKSMTGAKRLKSELPLSMFVLDLGGGLFPKNSSDVITPNEFKSQLLWSFWWGLSDPGAKWSKDMPHMDWQEFDKHSGGLFKHDAKFLASYVVVSDTYLHVMIRFGYHFSVVDAFCGERPESNYINFRFKGGGASMEQRMLRLEFIARVLGHFGFGVTTKGDLLDAKCARRGETDTLKRLAEVGYILAITRLMDMGLTDLEQVDEMVDTFIQNRVRD